MRSLPDSVTFKMLMQILLMNKPFGPDFGQVLSCVISIVAVPIILNFLVKDLYTVDDA